MTAPHGPSGPDLVPVLRGLTLLHGLDDDRLAALAAAGERVVLDAGSVPFQQGGEADEWWLLLDGELELVRRVGREDVVVGRLDVPGRWAGGFRAWDPHGVYLATARVVRRSTLLRVPAAALRRLTDAWFPFGSHLVEGLFGTARTIEAQARQRESLVTLGTLAAGLAHELNNPAAAAVRAVASLREVSAELLDSLRELAEVGTTAEQFHGLDRLRQELGEPTGHGAARGLGADALGLSDLEEEVGEWLERRGARAPWELGARLAAAGGDPAWCQRVADLLGDDRLLPGLEWVGGTVTVAGLLAEVGESTRRVSDLVGAVRSYSQMDRAAVQPVDVTEGIDSTLLMLGHRLRDGVTVVRDYAPGLPLVEADSGELNQVWTNLVGNAVDAMDGVGTLQVRTRADGDHVVVEVGDTGAGMAPEVAARAFEAFFTTKDVGHGTGLGLDIARRIVEERHHGSIELVSRPGRTVFTVRLPLRHHV